MNCLLISVLVLLIITISQCQINNEEVKNVETRRVRGDFQTDEERNRFGYPNDFSLPDTPRRGYDQPPHHHVGPPYRGPPDFHHHHHHHNHAYGDSGQPSIGIEDEDSLRNSTIPLDFARSLNDIIANDLLLTAIEDTPDNLKTPLVTTRFSEVDSNQSERSAALIARPAKCMPELTTVRIAQSEDRNVFYVPECTRVERCGGCCSHILLSCQPEETETVTFSVLKTEYTGNNKLKYVGLVPIPVEKHTKCKCKCKVKEEDCSDYQEYRESECRCVCKNPDEERKCYKNSYLKLWNPDQCACQCREIQPCSTGFEFDHNECRCIQSQLRRRYVLTGYTNKENPEY